MSTTLDHLMVSFNSEALERTQLPSTAAGHQPESQKQPNSTSTLPDYKPLPDKLTLSIPCRQFLSTLDFAYDSFLPALMANGPRIFSLRARLSRTSHAHSRP